MTESKGDVLRGLLERVRAATGPDREMTYSIAKAVGWRPEPGEPGSTTSSPWAWCADFTASIDAAIALVKRCLPGAMWCVGTMEDGAFCRLVVLNSRGDYIGGERCVTAATEPLAILAALLAALLAQEVQP